MVPGYRKEGQPGQQLCSRGCMVIKSHMATPFGKRCVISWTKCLETGHVNAYFPLFVPKSLFETEEKCRGLCQKCAIVTHYRLKADENNKGKLMVDPEAKLEGRMVVRPTSEAIIWNTYRDWIQSYRDLPILINQWANVVRWEMRTQSILRTAEFYGRGGAYGTCHQTRYHSGSTNDARCLCQICRKEWMAMPVIKRSKTENERFARCRWYLYHQTMMQDGKALQAGTSHFWDRILQKAFE